MAAPSRPARFRAVGPTPIASRAWFKRSQRILGRDWPTAYLFVGLTVLLLGTIKAYPFLRALWYSFHNAHRRPNRRLRGPAPLHRALGRRSVHARGRRDADVHGGLGGAEAGARDVGLAAPAHVPRWGAFFGGLLLVPYVVPEVVRALAWRMILDLLLGGANHILVDVLGVMAKATRGSATRTPPCRPSSW